ncbi:MAG: ribbon-helix-helix domain-containing protein [Pseudomonadota bacterium]
MAEESNKEYINTTVRKELLRSLKILAAQEGVRINQLLEEAIQDLLKKYEKKAKGKL